MSDVNANGQQTGQGFSRWQKLLLVGLVVVNLGLYGMVFLLTRGTSPAPDAPKLTMGESLDLPTAHKQSLALALGLLPDAQLVGATGSWQLASGDRLTWQRPAWSFSFYSPSTRWLQVVTVDQRGAQAGPRQRVDVAPQHAMLDWNLESDDLLLTFLSHGGEEFIGAHPGANIHMQLKGEDTARSIWYIAAVDPVARQSFVVGVDALSRQVVQVNEGGG
jgi:hypothetical protein